MQIADILCLANKENKMKKQEQNKLLRDSVAVGNLFCEGNVRNPARFCQEKIMEDK